ncbi:MAG: TonB-dependent receptor [Saprospiraceae bacterium]|nr:TonB-dependent receptor [Saprospiraceae bacterium]
MRKYWIISFFFYAGLSMAQSATLQGIITDAENGTALLSATIAAGTIGTTSDENGAYQLELAAGKHIVTFSYLGYDAYELVINLSDQEVKVWNVALEPQSTLLQTTTITSGRYEKPLSEVTISLEVLKPTLLESNNTVNISSILTKVPGVSIIDGQANIRGGSGYSYGAGSRVLLLVDDIPILSADAGSSNWRDIPVENIEQIEVVKGAASVLYGSSALNGVINVRTAYAKSEPITKIASFSTLFFKPKEKELAWWDTPPVQFGSSVSHRRKLGKVDLVLGALYSNESGFIKDETPNAEQPGTFRRYGRFNSNVRYRINDKLSVGFATNFNRGSSKDFFFWKGINDLYTGAVSTISEGTQWRFNIDPFVTYFDAKGNRHKLLGRYYQIDNEFNNDQSNGSKLYYGEYQFQRQFEQIGVVTTAGLVATGSTTQAALYGESEYQSLNTAVYLQADKKFFNRLTLSTGFRYERNTINNDLFFDAFSGQEVAANDNQEAKPVFRLGSNYQVAENTFLRASFGQGYRFPTVAEKFISTTIAGGIRAVPNIDLQSESGWTTEVGVKQGFRISGFEGIIDFSAFWSEYQDMMEFNLAFNPSSFQIGFQSQNVGDTKIQGVELTVAGRGSLFNFPTTLLAGYTFIEPTFKEFDLAGKQLSLNNLKDAPIGQFNAWSSSSSENVLKYRFQHLFTFDAETNIKMLSLGVGASYNSNMEAIDAIIQADDRFVPDANDFRAKYDNGFFLLSFRAGYKLGAHFKILALLNNALNTEYSVRVGVIDAPRNASLRMDAVF